MNKELLATAERLKNCWSNVETDIKKWVSQKSTVEKRIKALNDNIANADYEIEEILMERIRDKENREIYDRMLEKRREEIERFKNEISEIENIDKTIKERRSEMKQSIELLEQILAEKKISHTNLMLLIDKIIIWEDENGLTLEINIKAPFTDGNYDEEFEWVPNITNQPKQSNARRQVRK